MINNTYPGKFIVFEGLDGSGQSTQAALLRDYFTEQGKEVILTKEPTKDSDAGKEIRRVLDGKETIDSFELQKLFALDRKEHLEKLVIPALKEGKTVISDRYFFSSFAFGSSEGLNLESLVDLNKEYLMPDLTILLKVSPEVCVDRIEKRGEGIKLFEKRDKLARVWESYKIFPGKFENVHLVNGEASVEEVFAEVKSAINSKL